MSSTQQQVFNLQLIPANTFETFYANHNPTLIKLLRSVASGEQQEPQIFLWGAANTGKTHLLQAVCHVAAKSDRRAIYIPLAKLPLRDPNMLQGFETMDVICIDDVHVLSAQPEWEQMLFNFINQVRAEKTSIIFSANENPAEEIFMLADLNSRAVWGPVYKLPTLNEEELDSALCLHAKSRGFTLTKEVRSYLFKHCRRDVPTLVDILQILDHASLQEQRKVTVPFLKKILSIP